MAGRRRGPQVAAAIGIALATVIAIAVTASGQSSDSSSSSRRTRNLNYTGAFTTVDGRPANAQLGVVSNSVDIVVHQTDALTDHTVTFTAKLAVQGTLYDENHSSQNDVCIRFEIGVQDQPFPISALHDDYEYAPIEIPLTDTSAEDHGCSQAAATPMSKKGMLQLNLVKVEQPLDAKKAKGVLDYDNSKFEFEGTIVGDTADTGFLEGTAITKSVFEQALSNSTCTFSELDQDYGAQPEDCRALRALRNTFFDTFKSNFRKEDVLANLSTVVMLRALMKPDGRPLMPTLSALTPIIGQLALKADSPDDDGTAQSAMNRLINIAIALDLAAAK